MSGCRIPGPLCATRSEPIDSGTLNKQRSPAPKPVGSYRPAVLTHLGVDAATYHRTFLTPEAAASASHYNLAADISVEADRGYLSPFRAAYIKAYEVDVSARSLAPTSMMKKPDQDFAKYATPFEQEYSDLVKYHDWDIPPTVPVVVRNGDNFSVVGYVAEATGIRLLVPKGVSTDYKDLRKTFEKGVPFFVSTEKGPLWTSAGISEFSYTVLTRVDGGVVQFLASRATGFVESEFGPILLIATALAPLGQGLVRGIISSLFRRESGAVAGNLALDGMTDELAQSVTAEASTTRVVEIGAGDLRASIEMAKKGRVKVIAVDPVPAPAAAIKELESLGGNFVRGTADSLSPGSADHVFQYFPWRIGGTGSHISGGTWRLIDDAVKVLRPGGAAHFVTEDYATAEFLAEEASKKGLRVALTESAAGAAAPGASGVGVPSFSSALKVWLVNIYK